MSNQTHRVLELIRRFNNNEKVCIDRLKQELMWEGKSDKTIRRDLDIIKKVFPDTFHLIRGEQGCYKAVTRSLFENITSAEQLSLLVQTLNIADRSNLFDDLNIDTSDRTILEKQIKETKNIYLFKSKPYEVYNITKSKGQGQAYYEETGHRRQESVGWFKVRGSWLVRA